MEGLVTGRIVHYVLTPTDKDEINRHHLVDDVGENWPVGAMVNIGNRVFNGEHVPMIVVAVWPEEYPDGSGINGQAFLDGNDSLWVTNIWFSDDKEPGTWHWIEKA